MNNIKENKKLYIFISCDLVNSTKLKATQGSKWFTVITQFYEQITRSLRREIENVQVFKYIGDEVVLYTEVLNKYDIVETPKKLLKIQQQINEALTTQNDTPVKLGVKITLWLAPIMTLSLENISNVSDSEKEINKYEIFEKIIENEPLYRNISTTGIISDTRNKQGNLLNGDILGEDMDTGFRISKFSHKNFITVNLLYVAVLNKLTEERNDKFKIVSLKKLKGVWGKRYYPIIWYTKDWDNINSLFDYDEYKNNDIVKNILDSCHLTEFDFLEILHQIDNETNIKTHINKISEICQNLRSEKVLPSNWTKENIKNEFAGIHDVVLNMNKKGFTPEQISKATNLSKEDINKIITTA